MYQCYVHNWSSHYSSCPSCATLYSGCKIIETLDGIAAVNTDEPSRDDYQRLMRKQRSDMDMIKAQAEKIERLKSMLDVALTLIDRAHELIMPNYPDGGTQQHLWVEASQKGCEKLKLLDPNSEHNRVTVA